MFGRIYIYHNGYNIYKFVMRSTLFKNLIRMIFVNNTTLAINMVTASFKTSHTYNTIVVLFGRKNNAT